MPTHKHFEIFMMILLLAVGCYGCVSRPDVSEKSLPDRNLLIVVLNDTLMQPSYALPPSLGGEASVPMYLETLAQQSMHFRLLDATDQPTRDLFVLDDNRQPHWFKQLEALGWQTGFAGTWPYNGPPADISYWIGEPSHPNGLAIPEHYNYGGQGVFVPVQRTGMTVPIRHPLQGAYHADLGRLASHFMLYQGVHERPWVMCVSLVQNNSLGYPYAIDEVFVNQARLNGVDIHQQPATASVLMINHTLSFMVEYLTWLQKEEQTLFVVIYKTHQTNGYKVLVKAPLTMPFYTDSYVLTTRSLITAIDVWLKDSFSARTNL